ncbi:MAG: hypothetical protein J0L92_32825 [Deltaproteobacteria bacterium]|nr:hypothetical protein [Deltaproteobacteria bacterium]
MHAFLTLGLALLGFASASLAGLALARFALDVIAHRREVLEARALGPFRHDAALRTRVPPTVSVANLLLAAAVAATWLVMVVDRSTHLEEDAHAVWGDRDSSRILAGDPSLVGLGHVVRASAPLTGVGGTMDDGVLRIVAYGGVALDQVTQLARVLADVDRASVQSDRDRFELEIRFVEGRAPRWNAEAINDCLVVRIAR